MHDWKNRQERKRARQSHTSGDQKTKQCQTTPLKKFLATRERSYKYPEYARWDEIFGKR